MAQMFCTLKQAADKLETTEAQIEAMLNDGILREFRDGSSRLLKVADLTGLAVAAGSVTGERRSTRAQRKAGSTRPGHTSQGHTSLDVEIKLPPAAVATAGVGCAPREAAPKRPPRRPQQPTGRGRTPRAVVRKPAASPRRQSPPRAVVISPTLPAQRLTPPTYEMSVRQWIWTGLIDDNPLAIFIVFGTILLGVGALAGAGYLLLEAL